MSKLLNTYRAIKAKYPNSLIWIENEDYILTLAQCAIVTAENLNTTLTPSTLPDLLTTGFPSSSLETYTRMMVQKGYSVAIVTQL